MIVLFLRGLAFNAFTAKCQNCNNDVNKPPILPPQSGGSQRGGSSSSSGTSGSSSTAPPPTTAPPLPPAEGGAEQSVTDKEPMSPSRAKEVGV